MVYFISEQSIRLWFIANHLNVAQRCQSTYYSNRCQAGDNKSELACKTEPKIKKRRATNQNRLRTKSNPKKRRKEKKGNEREKRRFWSRATSNMPKKASTSISHSKHIASTSKVFRIVKISIVNKFISLVSIDAHFTFIV